VLQIHVKRKKSAKNVVRVKKSKTIVKEEKEKKEEGGEATKLLARNRRNGKDNGI